MKIQNRKISLDFIRTIAVLSVVAMHTDEAIYSLLNAESIANLRLPERITAMGMYVLGRMGVPLFLMLTGYLLLPRHYDEQKTLQFWKKSLLPMIGVTMLWNAFFYIFSVIYNNGEFNIVHFLKEVLFLRAQTAPHMWYMAMIIGVYLFIPLISMLLEKLPLKLILIPMSAVTFFLICIPAASTLLRLLGKGEIKNQIAFDFSGSYYGLYIIAGYLFSHIKEKKVNAYIAFAVSVLAFAAETAYMVLNFSTGHQYNLWYWSFGIFVCCVCMFAAFVDAKKIPFKKLFYHISKNSFGIFLVHPTIIMIIVRFVSVTRENTLSFLFLFAAVFALSDLTVTLISYIPKIGKKLFLMK